MARIPACFRGSRPWPGVNEVGTTVVHTFFTLSRSGVLSRPRSWLWSRGIMRKSSNPVRSIYRGFLAHRRRTGHPGCVTPRSRPLVAQNVATESAPSLHPAAHLRLSEDGGSETLTATWRHKRPGETVMDFRGSGTGVLGRLLGPRRGAAALLRNGLLKPQGVETVDVGPNDHAGRRGSPHATFIFQPWLDRQAEGQYLR